MQLEAIKVFCDIASCRSFSKAAAANGLSQPAVSRIVHLLEARLNGQLIDRSRRPLRLTELGQAYYEGCRKLLEQYAELEASLIRAHPHLELTIRVAAIYSVGLGDMGQYVERFEQQHPHVKVHIDYLHPDLVYEQTLEGTSDFGLVSYPCASKQLAVLPWREEEMVVACSPSHPLAGLTTMPVSRLDGEKYIGFDRGLIIRREIDRFLRERGVSVEVVLEFDNIENIKKGIEIGAGLALLPEPTFRQEVRVGALRAIRLEGCKFARPLGVIHRRRELGTAAGDFINLLRGTGSLAAGEHNGNGTGSHRTSGSQRKKAAT
jgi:DNA-binding transcriptional LysR family regulator